MIYGKIEINNMKVFGRVGVFEQERKVGNTFDVTVHVVHPIDEAAADHLEGALSYVHLVAIIKEEMAQEARMIENVAYRIAESVRRSYPQVRSGMVRVAKITPPLGEELGSAAVSIEF